MHRYPHRRGLFPNALALGPGGCRTQPVPKANRSQLCLASRNKHVLTRDRPVVWSLLIGDDLALITAGT